MSPRYWLMCGAGRHQFLSNHHNTAYGRRPVTWAQATKLFERAQRAGSLVYSVVAA